MNAPEIAELSATGQRWSWLPPIGSKGYYFLLAALGMLVLGPLTGVTSSYMNFSLGFFVGGQVLAGILGSAVTYGYGAEGKHGANFMQTTAASVSDMAALAVLIQASVWLGLPQVSSITLIGYMLCAGMFGAGVGMLYTPIVVDRLQLMFPSGLAVANILRALTDRELLTRSIKQLGSGTVVGVVGGLLSALNPFIGNTGLSTSTLGAGMIVSARIGVPAITAGVLFTLLHPFLESIGWLEHTDPFRKISFLIGLGMILGAGILDIGLILHSAYQRWKAPQQEAVEEMPDWKKTNNKRLIAWTVFWGIGIVAVGTMGLNEPVGYMVFAVLLTFVFALVNGISVGISDSNPISSAFVVTVILMASLGLKQPLIGLMAASVVMVACSVACDMQQDRSTGWRLGTNRILQFRYQIAGVLVGAILAVGFAKMYMAAYPILTKDQTIMTAAEQPAQWTSAMTYKIVGALRTLTEDKPYQRTAIWVGVAAGLLIAVLRRWIKNAHGYQNFVKSGKAGFTVDFLIDTVVLPSPYAFSFGTFFPLNTSAWFGGGGVLSSAINTYTKHFAKPDPSKKALPEDMSSTSLWGGGLIAGDSLSALALGIYGLAHTVLS